LRHIADFHGIRYQRGTADVTVAVTRDDVAVACQQLAAAGVPAVSDLDAIYDRFRTRRADYEDVLLAICAFVYAPPAPWSSDKVVAPRSRPPIVRV